MPSHHRSRQRRAPSSAEPPRGVSVVEWVPAWPERPPGSSMMVKEELVYEYWDCKYCRREAIRGDEERCPGCGHDRDMDITFYRRAEDEVVGDAGQADRFRAGPDW